MTEREDPVKELEKTHQHWKDIYENGCFDPLWSDGVNLNLVRSHMFYYQELIDKAYGDSEKPSVYYKTVPDEVDPDYMARKDEIMKRAVDFYMRCSEMQEVLDLQQAPEYLSEKEMKDLHIAMDIDQYQQLGKAILENNYRIMRDLSWDAEKRIQEINEAHERLINRPHPEGEQLSLFEIKM